MTPCIGLTGGIGCGKSTVTGLFAKHGAGIVDTDAIAHQLTQAGGAAISPLMALFGESYLTAEGALDRPKMRQLIFSDTGAKQQLERLLHPLILEQAKMLLGQLHDRPYTILVVPLLPESPAFRQLVQRILVVDCSEDIQSKRVAQRSGMSDAEICAIIAQQTPRDARLQLADDIIRNDGDLDSLTRQVATLHERYAGMKQGI